MSSDDRVSAHHDDHRCDRPDRRAASSATALRARCSGIRCIAAAVDRCRERPARRNDGAAGWPCGGGTRSAAWRRRSFCRSPSTRQPRSSPRPSRSILARASSTAGSCCCSRSSPSSTTLAARDRASTIIDVILTVGAASAAFGIIQYALLHYDSLGRAAGGGTVTLHDLLGHADAGHLRRRRPTGLRLARTHVAGARDAGARRGTRR